MQIQLKEKKYIIFVTVFCIAFAFLFHHYNSEAHARNVGCGVSVVESDIKIKNTIMNNGSIVTTYNDGSVLTEYTNGVYELNIPLVSPFFSDEEREYIIKNGNQRGFIAMAKIFLQIVGGIFTACEVIEWLSNYQFNPCQVARQYLGSNARTGHYVVEGNYIPGQVPGCEPIHSLPCNSGYYQYRFIPD